MIDELSYFSLIKIQSNGTPSFAFKGCNLSVFDFKFENFVFDY